MFACHAQACDARLMVAITFHYRPQRLKYLFRTVKALVGFPVSTLSVLVFTDAVRPEEHAAIDALCRPLFAGGAPGPSVDRSVRIVPCPGLPDPRNLGWCHKALIRDRFLAGPDDHDLFIYLEEDIELSFLNLCYFIQYRSLLKGAGLIPSFLRVEYNYDRNALFSTDQWEVTSLSDRAQVQFGEHVFVNMANPYAAMFILDRELAAEYAASRSFDLEASREVQTWEILERAAMGLCFENPPPPFYARHVVPVEPRTLLAPSFCWVYHIPNTYANAPDHPHGKMPMDQIFRPAPPVRAG